MLKIWHLFLKIAFVYAIYHLIRDVLQDILGIRNFFTQIAHFEPDPKKVPKFLHFLFFGGYRQYLTLPIEIFTIITVPRVLKNKNFTKLDLVMIFVLSTTALLYLMTIIFGN